MEDPTTWKSHTFTLFVFTGIVVLSSIFFVLGMLVGRAQEHKIVSSAVPAEAVKSDAGQEPKDDKPRFTFYDSAKKEPPAVLEPAPAKPESPDAAAGPGAGRSAAPARPVTAKPENVVNYQIAALRRAADAERLLEEVKKKGFRGFILSPAADESNPYFRVQVGPFSDPVEALDVKGKLESAGYRPILKK